MRKLTGLCVVHGRPGETAVEGDGGRERCPEGTDREGYK